MAYKYIAEEGFQPEKSFVEELMRERLVQWRKQPSTLRIEHPTRLDRARTRLQSQTRLRSGTHKSAQRRTPQTASTLRQTPQTHGSRQIQTSQKHQAHS